MSYRKKYIEEFVWGILLLWLLAILLMSFFCCFFCLLSHFGLIRFYVEKKILLQKTVRGRLASPLAPPGTVCVYGPAITFCLQFVCVAGSFKRSNDTSKVNIHIWINYNIITEIYINILRTTTQIFIALDYLILMSEKYLYFRKRQKHVASKFFLYPVEVTGSMYFRNAFQIMETA